jgi:hypothetical protein
MNKINLVTGLWMGRQDRDENRYIPNFVNVLKLELPMSVYVPKRYEQLVLDIRKDILDITDIHIVELTDIRDNWFSKYWNKLQAVRTNPEWYNSVSWLKGVPQYFSEWYNPIVMNKPLLVNHSYQINKFNSDKWIWIDAGITQHIPSEWVNKKSISKFGNKITNTRFTAFEYYGHEVHGFNYEGFKKYTDKIPQWCCRATMFGMDKDKVERFYNDYTYLLDDTLSRGYLGTEESIFTLMSLIDNEVYEYDLLVNDKKNGLPENYLKDLTINDNE